jgi:hypothetical protein
MSMLFDACAAYTRVDMEVQAMAVGA